MQTFLMMTTTLCPHNNTGRMPPLMLAPPALQLEPVWATIPKNSHYALKESTGCSCCAIIRNRYLDTGILISCYCARILVNTGLFRYDGAMGEWHCRQLLHLTRNGNILSHALIQKCPLPCANYMRLLSISTIISTSVTANGHHQASKTLPSKLVIAFRLGIGKTKISIKPSLVNE